MGSLENFTDASASEKTMMISFEDANVTDWTVVRPRWSMMMALCAKNSIRLYTFLITAVTPNKGQSIFDKIWSNKGTSEILDNWYKIRDF